MTPAGGVEASLPRPRLRGVIHRYAAVAFAAAFIVLVGVAPDTAAAVWVGTYGLCVTAMLAVSATYHTASRSPEARRFLQRLDHSMILVAIAGSYTGIVGLALQGRERTAMLVAVWALAALGVALRMLWLDAPYWITAIVYVAVGWVAVFDLAGLQRALSLPQLILVVIGGVVYSIGAVVYALHRPNPWPETFGYHEIFHALVVIAASMHLVAVVLLLRDRGVA